VSLKLQASSNAAKKLLMITLVVLFLSLVIAGKTANAASLSMPEEYVNYTITRVDGVLWAKIDGTYPITYSGSEDSMLMVYPTPPGTTNISVWLNDALLDWSNFTEVYPEMLHHTAIGDWQMISTVLQPVSDYFVLKIHYEHPIQVINGSYVFLYDLNIKEYLSTDANKSIAHFIIHFETEIADLNVNTVFGVDETLKPIEFTVSGENPMEIRVDEVSEFDKPLPGDLLVSFSEPQTDDTMIAPWIVVSALVAGLVVAALIVYCLLRKRKAR
jgi:hypothetical protein